MHLYVLKLLIERMFDEFNDICYQTNDICVYVMQHIKRGDLQVK